MNHVLDWLARVACILLVLFLCVAGAMVALLIIKPICTDGTSTCAALAIVAGFAGLVGTLWLIAKLLKLKL